MFCPSMKHWISYYFDVVEVITLKLYGVHFLKLRDPKADLLAKEIPWSLL